MKFCENCIVPDSFPNVIFENGICSFCINSSCFSQTRVAPLGKDKLLGILNSVRTGEREYDCVVPLSGGKDSSYALFYVVKELGLKPLAVNFDSGFTTEISKINIERICKALSVDLIIGRSRKAFRRKAVIEALYIGKYTGDFFRICGNCENNNRTLAINEATKRKIPFIIWGSTEFETIPKSYSGSQPETFREWYASNINYLRSILKRALWLFGSGMTLGNKCKTIWRFLKHFYYISRDNIDSGAPGGWKKVNPFLRVSLENENVKTIYLYDYVKYDPYKYIEILKKETGWEAPSGREARADCKLHFILNYQHLKSTGITHDGFYLATMVREGLLSRGEAMEKEEILKECSEREYQEVLEDLGFQEEAGI